MGKKNFKSRALNKRSVNINEFPDEETGESTLVNIQIRPVLYKDMLLQIHAIDPGAFAEFQNITDETEQKQFITQFAEDPEGMVGRLTTGLKMSEAYLVFGVVNPFKITWSDTPEEDLEEDELTIPLLRSLFPDEEIEKLERAIKRISGVIERKAKTP